MKEQKKIIIFGLVLVFLFVPFLAQAGPFTEALGWVGVYFGGFTLFGIIGSIITGLFALIGILSLLFLIIGGFRYVTAYGSTDQAEAAKKTVLYAIIGLIIAISAYVIVRAVSEALF